MLGLELPLLILLIVCIICVCAFEFINGFHDTANAVATVIYTNSLKPKPAVVLSAFLNFLGVLLGGIGVAVSIINLLPVETLISQDVWDSIGMVLALLLTAIAWNLGTWYLGIPCSSSHTLIGSILGVGIAFAFLPGNEGTNVNWGKAISIGQSLLLSPLVGLSLAAILMFILRKTVKNKKVFEAPEYKKAPPTWIRAILILTCSSVSFSHGSNDGQKGVGLMMLVLIGILPFQFAIDVEKDRGSYVQYVEKLENDFKNVNVDVLSKVEQESITEYQTGAATLKTLLQKEKLEGSEPFEIRKNILVIDRGVKNIFEEHPNAISEANLVETKSHLNKIKELTN